MQLARFDERDSDSAQQVRYCSVSRILTILVIVFMKYLVWVLLLSIATRYFGGDSDMEYLYSFSDILHTSNYSTTVDITYPSVLDALYSNSWITYNWAVSSPLIWI